MNDSPDAAATAKLSTRIDDLTRRLDMLEAERAVIDVLNRYASAIDDGDPEAWAELFTEDAVWQVAGAAARIAVRIEGRSELRRFAENHTAAPEAWHKHCVVEPRVDVEGSRATSTCYTFRLDGFPDGPVVQSFGRYHDQLVRDDRGQWRIAHRTVMVESARESPFGYRPPATS